MKIQPPDKIAENNDTIAFLKAKGFADLIDVMLTDDCYTKNGRINLSVIRRKLGLSQFQIKAYLNKVRKTIDPDALPLKLKKPSGKKRKKANLLTPKEVAEIKKLSAKGEKGYMIAKKFNRSPTTICYVLKGDTYKYN